MTRPASLELWLSAVRRDVADTGTGISTERMATLFEAFDVHGRPRPASRTGGTGLGLAVSRQLLRAMRGDIGVASQPGGSSRFSFTLPRAD